MVHHHSLKILLLLNTTSYTRWWRWGGLENLAAGTTLLDVGCGIGGSSRILAKDYNFDVTGVTISPQQVKRAQELTPEGVDAKFPSR